MATSYKDPSVIATATQMEAKHGLPAGLLVNIITKGERSNSDQVSPVGAKTIAQIMPATRLRFMKQHGIDAYLSTENALEVAALHLKGDLDRTGGDVGEAVASYIAGPSGKNRGPDTRAYVQRVTGAPLAGAGARPATTAAVTRAKSTADLYSAYKGLGGTITPAEKAQFEADVRDGKVTLPRGATLDVTPGAAKSDATPISAKILEKYNNHSDMTEAQRAMIDRDVAKGYLAVPEGAALKRPDPRTAGDYAGMTGRAALTGVGKLGDFIQMADPTRMLPGKQYEPGKGDAAANAVGDVLDLTKPGTPGEKLLTGIVEGGIQGAVTGPLGGARGIGARVLAETVGGAAAGGSMEAAEQAGAPLPVQIALGLAGGVSGVVAAEKTVARLAERFGPKAAKVLESTPKAVLVDEAGELTEDGIEAAVRAEVSPDEFKAAIEEVHAPDAPVAGAVDEVATTVAPDAPPVAGAIDETVSPAPVAEPALQPATGGVRASEAASEGVTLSRGQATREFDTYASEQTLKASNGPEAEQARQFFAKQQDDLQAATLKFRENFGDASATPAERGATVKESLREMQDQGAKGVSAAYKEGRDLAEAASAKAGSNSAALLDLDVTPIQAKMKELLIDQIVPSETRAGLRQIAAQYGLIGRNPRVLEDGTTIVEIADAAGKAGGSIPLPRPVERLSITNAENFRKDVNALYRGDNTGRSQSLKGPLDEAFNAAVDRAATEGTGGIGQAFQTARAKFQTQKKTFEAKDAVSKIVDFKKGTQTDQIIDESVIKEVFKSTADLKKVKAILLSSPTENSKAAWKTIQANGVGELFDKAFNLNANGGEGMLSGERLSTAITKFGVDKLKILLEPADFDQLMKLRRIARNVTIAIPGSVNPSGSGYAMVRFLAKQATGLAGVARVIPGSGLLTGVIDAGAALMKQGREAAQTTKTLEGITSYKPANDVGAPTPPSGGAPGVAASPAAAKTPADPAKFIRDFIDLTKSEEFIAPAFATAASAGEHP